MYKLNLTDAYFNCEFHQCTVVGISELTTRTRIFFFGRLCIQIKAAFWASSDCKIACAFQIATTQKPFIFVPINTNPSQNPPFKSEYIRFSSPSSHLHFPQILISDFALKSLWLKMSSAGAHALLLFTFFLSTLTWLTRAETSVVPARRLDGNAIDQAIAYVLMFVALFVTYFLH